MKNQSNLLSIISCQKKLLSLSNFITHQRPEVLLYKSKKRSGFCLICSIKDRLFNSCIWAFRSFSCWAFFLISSSLLAVAPKMSSQSKENEAEQNTNKKKKTSSIFIRFPNYILSDMAYKLADSIRWIGYFCNNLFHIPRNRGYNSPCKNNYPLLYSSILFDNIRSHMSHHFGNILEHIRQTKRELKGQLNRGKQAVFSWCPPPFLLSKLFYHNFTGAVNG